MKMTYANAYWDDIDGILEKIRQNEAQYRETAAAILARVKQGGMIFPFGTGHGHLLALEMFYRAGGMMGVNPILTEELMLHKSATGSSAFERSEGKAEPLLQEFKVSDKDVVIVFSNSGINPLTIEMALGAKERGAQRNDQPLCDEASGFYWKSGFGCIAGKSSDEAAFKR